MSALHKVLVTGGAGFVGSHVAEYFARGGAEVIAVDNLSRKNVKYNVEYLKRFRNVKFRKGDVTEPGSIRSLARGADAIVHTAGQVAVTSSLSDPKHDFQTNAEGTLNLLEIARKNDSPFIFCSTNKVYGANVNGIPIREERMRYAFADPRYKKGVSEDFSVDYSQHSPYGCSKFAGDLYTQEYFHTYGLKTAVFRMSCIYGDRQFGTEEQGWLAWFTIAVLLGMPITIFGDGKQVRDVLYVRDLIRAFATFLERSDKLGGNVFNIGGGSNNTVSLLELIALLKRLTGKKPKITMADWRPADQKVYITDISKIERSLDWEPETKPITGVERIMHWVRENRTLF